jgi:hypothetical protein
MRHLKRRGEVVSDLGVVKPEAEIAAMPSVSLQPSGEVLL